MRSDLARHGVAIVDLTKEREDGQSITVVDATGDRSVVSTDAGTAVMPAPDDLGLLVDDAEVVLIEGHHLDVAVSAAQAARASGRPVVVDAGRWKPVMADLLPLADDSPARATSGGRGPPIRRRRRQRSGACPGGGS